MPKILINEIDLTTPGAPGSYANYSVLIAGFEADREGYYEDTNPSISAKSRVEADGEKYKVEKTDFDFSGRLPRYRIEKETIMEANGREKTSYAVVYNRPVAPDDNGVYEFTSADDFEKTIGLVAPKVVVEGAGGADATELYHYGNQMAYELLKIGYPVIYKPFRKPADGETYATVVKELGDESFWEIFKDKANYDFRFVTHGLLESTDMSTVGTYQEKAKSLQNNQDRLALVETAIRELEEIASVAAFNKDNAKTNQELEEALDENDLYSELLQNDLSAFEGLIKADKTPYANYEEAVTGTKTEADTLKAQNAILEEELEELLTNGISRANISAANEEIANLATYVVSENPTADDSLPGRGDCTALIEMDERCYVNTTSSKKPEILIVESINRDFTGITAANGKFCALTVPSVVYTTGKKFPGAFHYLACFINSLQLGFAEWYAAAGYTRGVSSYNIDHTTVKLGEIAINALEPRYWVDQATDPKFACNVIANFRNNYYLWGNRTCHPLGQYGNLKNGDLVASSFLNIRQLCSTIKKQLYVACRRFTFDPNSDTLWFNFVNAIKPTLEAMKADQGVRDYRIVKVYTDKKATLKAKIRIIPIEAVEDFDLEISLEDSFGETTATIAE